MSMEKMSNVTKHWFIASVSMAKHFMVTIEISISVQFGLVSVEASCFIFFLYKLEMVDSIFINQKIASLCQLSGESFAILGRWAECNFIEW